VSGILGGATEDGLISATARGAHGAGGTVGAGEAR
jgi:hypothetical protein